MIFMNSKINKTDLEALIFRRFKIAAVKEEQISQGTISTLKKIFGNDTSDLLGWIALRTSKAKL